MFQWKGDVSLSKRETDKCFYVSIEMHDRSVGAGTSPHTHYTTHFGIQNKCTFDIEVKHSMTLGGHRRF